MEEKDTEIFLFSFWLKDGNRGRALQLTGTPQYSFEIQGWN